METALIFGIFNVPADLSYPASYTCPNILPKDVMDKISFSRDIVESDEEVTHQVFFGENFNRLKNAIKGK